MGKYFKRVSVWWLMIWQRWYFLWELVGTFVQLSQYLAFLARSFQLHMFPHSYQRRSLISRLPKIFHIINYHFSKLNYFRNYQDWHPLTPPHHYYHIILIKLAMSALIWLRVSASKTCGASSLPGLRHSVKPWLRWRWWSEEGFELPWASFDYLKSAQKIIAQMPGLDGAGSSYCSWRWLWWWWWLRNLRKLCLCIKQRRPHIVHLIKGSKFMLLAFV